MELGSLVCTKTNPSCKMCPIHKGCVSRKKDVAHIIPLHRRQKKYQKTIIFFIIKKGEFFLLEKNSHQKGDKGWWKDLWTFPYTFDTEWAHTHFKYRAQQKLQNQTHHVTKYHLTVESWIVSYEHIKSYLSKNHVRWLSLRALQEELQNEKLPHSSLVQKIIRSLNLYYQEPSEEIAYSDQLMWP